MRVQVIMDANGRQAPSKVVETLFTEQAMRLHGEAVLRKECRDRNALVLDNLVDNVFLKPTDTVKIVENEIGKTHSGIVSGFNFSVEFGKVSMNYTAEVVL